MKECGSGKNELELRTLLGCFLFSGDDIDKKIKVLSGGEKARVALAKTIVSKANFLLLDEPTNHLDLHSVELLIEALNKYEGTLILVSHDRYFISKIANKIWEIDDFKIREFKGTYAEWEEWKEKREAEKKESEKKAVPIVREEIKPSKQTQKRADTDAELKKEYQKLKKQFQQLEEKITTLNTKKNELESRMSHPDTYANKEKFQQAENEYQVVTEPLQRLNSEYETAFEKLVKMEQELGL
jgi:ATP-binding cassette subfamily F protein 3